MDQETTLFRVSPRRVRRPLSFATPIHKSFFKPVRSDNVQNVPKCKLSKSKVIEKISKNKFIIDFDVEKNYFLGDIDTTAYFKGEEYNYMFGKGLQNDNLVFQTPGWHFASPLKTARKQRLSSDSYGDFASVIKESRRDHAYEESPFCRLLNESDYVSMDKYQTLPEGGEVDDGYEAIRERFNTQMSVLEKFFLYYRQRSANVMDIFAQGSIFEIMGEENVHDVSVTLNALAKLFEKFEHEVGAIEFNYKFAGSDEENEIIVSTTGKLISHGSQSDFIISAKILVNECLIKHLKLKIC